MNRKTILIVEDEEDIQQLVGYNLAKAGFNVDYAETGEQAMERLQARPPDLILLDVMLPGIDGLEVCKMVRGSKQAHETPIIMLTAKGEEDDIISGLDQGADDYITKPFSPKVLISRVKAVLRRKAKETKQDGDDDGRSEVIRVHDLVIDTGRYEVIDSGIPVILTPTEFEILRLLAKRVGWVYSRQQIIDAVRGYDYLLSPRAIDVQVFGLRKKLKKSGSMIETIRGIGYKIKEPE